MAMHAARPHAEAGTSRTDREPEAPLAEVEPNARSERDAALKSKGHSSPWLCCSPPSVSPDSLSTFQMMNTGPIMPMQTIDQLRRDTRPLTQLGTVSDVTGEPLGSLLSRLAAKNIPLFVERPHEAHLYCVPQKQVGKYQEVIVTSTSEFMPSVPHITKKEIAPVEANHFRYLVLSSQDYSHLLDGDIALSAKLFSQVAFRESEVTDLSLVSAPQFIKEHLPNAHFHQRIKAKFACYFEERPNNEKTPDTLKMKRVQANAENLLISRKALLGLLGSEEKPDEPYPPELTEHLQPWKSEVLQALNKTAYDLYSYNYNTDETDKKLSSTAIEEAISTPAPPKRADEKELSETTISLCATMLRPKNNKPHIRQFLGQKTIDCYPFYFSLKLMYINEKSKEYHDNHLAGGEIPEYIQTVERNLLKDKILTLDLCNRLASDILPNYKEINRPEK
ncbi:hypothetical protein LL947_09240 [Halomonas sp. BLK-85]